MNPVENLLVNKIRRHIFDYIKGYDSDDKQAQQLREEAIDFFESEAFIECSPLNINPDEFMTLLDDRLRRKGKEELLKQLDKQFQKIGA